MPQDESPPPADPIVALLRELVAEQARQRQTLDAIRRLLERNRGARDQADVGVLVAVAESLGDRQYVASQVVAHAAAAPVLRDALEAADIDDAQQLGCLFRRLEGNVIDGLRLQGDRRPGEPVVWRILVCPD